MKKRGYTWVGKGKGLGTFTHLVKVRVLALLSIRFA